MKRVFISFLAVLMLLSSVSAISFEVKMEFKGYSYPLPFYAGDYAAGYYEDGFFILGPKGEPIFQPGLYSAPDLKPFHGEYPYCDDLFILQTNTNKEDFKYGVIDARDSKYGIIDANGDIKVPFQYDYLFFLNRDYACFELYTDSNEGDDGVVRISDGKVILKTDSLINFSADHKYFILTDRATDESTVYDLEGNIVPNMALPDLEEIGSYQEKYYNRELNNISLPSHLKVRSDYMIKSGDDYLIEVENKDELQGIYSKNKGLILDTVYADAYIIAQGRAIVVHKRSIDEHLSALYDNAGNEIIPFGQYDSIDGFITCNYISFMKLEAGRIRRFYALLKEGDMKPQPITDADTWAQDELKTAIDAGILPENMQHSYQGYINRQYFCRLVMQIYNKAVDNGLVQNAGFSNVKAFKDTEDIDVQHAAALGIVNGYGDGIFKPKELIKRSDAAVMLYRLAKVINPDAVMDKPLNFSDKESINAYARDAVAYISSAVDNQTNRRVMQGVSGNRFDPNGTYTRQQAYLSAIRLFDFVSQK